MQGRIDTRKLLIRMLTLSLHVKQGQLISESGTMSGGGGRPSRGRMALGSAAPRGNADAEAAQKELKQAEKQLEALTQVIGLICIIQCVYYSPHSVLFWWITNAT